MTLNNVSTAPVVIASVTPSVSEVGRVVVVMATYNGGCFIEEQIRSIQTQSYSDWTLYVRDDGSSDDTVQKVSQIECADNRVKLIRDDVGNQGAIGNFSSLMGVALEKNAKYVFFADQDDVWHPEKIAMQLAAMLEMERIYGVQTPLLVHSDLTVVSEALDLISESFVMFSGLSPATSDLGVLLCQNQVTGCACASNRALLELACPVPCEARMHDWWLALLASSCGKVGYIPKPLVKYRQHGNNVLGAISFSQRLKRLLFSPQRWKIQKAAIERGTVQAEMLEMRIKIRGIELSPVIMEQVNVYAQILRTHFLCRANKLRQQKIGMHVTIAQWGFNLLLSFMKKKEVKPVA